MSKARISLAIIPESYCVIHQQLMVSGYGKLWKAVKVMVGFGPADL